MLTCEAVSDKPHRHLNELVIKYVKKLYKEEKKKEKKIMFVKNVNGFVFKTSPIKTFEN